MSMFPLPIESRHVVAHQRVLEQSRGRFAPAGDPDQPMRLTAETIDT